MRFNAWGPVTYPTVPAEMSEREIEWRSALSDYEAAGVAYSAATGDEYVSAGVAYSAAFDRLAASIRALEGHVMKATA